MISKVYIGFFDNKGQVLVVKSDKREVSIRISWILNDREVVFYLIKKREFFLDW